jgi:hypothetical protein
VFVTVCHFYVSLTFAIRVSSPTIRVESREVLIAWPANNLHSAEKNYDTELITAVKCFTLQVPGACTIKLFTVVVVAVL